MQSKISAVIEVVVVFSLTMFLIALVGLSPIGKWEMQVLNNRFCEYLVMIAIPLSILVVTRRNLAAYGVSLRNFKYHLNITGTAFIPVALGSVPLAYVNYEQWKGALIMAVVQIAVLFVLGWLLRKKPTQNDNNILIGAVLLVACSNFLPKVDAGNAISAIVFYIFFLGLGEELLFRGYIQSRLNAAWGRPFLFFGVNWGWGMIIACVLFGLMHVLDLGSLISGNWQPAWAWGFWTFFGGLVFGFIREKTGSIVAPTLLHGLPQAIYTAFL